MGTYFQFQINSDRASSEIAKFLDEACSFLHDADATFSLYKSGSELSRIAKNELDLRSASSAMRNIQKECEVWKQTTDGWFDAVNPNGIFDPSGIVKTWAAEQACVFLEANGFDDFTLNAGGDVYLSRGLTVKSLFKVGLANLNKRESSKAGSNMVANLYGTEYKAAATSGSIEKGEHIWANKDGLEHDPVLQVTVIADELVKADVWATAIYSGGLSALDAFAKSNLTSKVPSVAVITFSGGSMLATNNFANLLESH